MMNNRAIHLGLITVNLLSSCTSHENFPDSPYSNRMPSKSLVSSWTASIISSSGTHPHLTPQNACPEKISAPRARLPVFKHLHGLWKGKIEIFLCRPQNAHHDLITICARTQAFHFPERGICSWQANPSSVEPHLPSVYTNMKERCWRLGSSRQRTLLSSFPPQPRQPRRRQPTIPVALIRIGLRSQPWKSKLEAGYPILFSMACPRLSLPLSRGRARALNPKLRRCHVVHRQDQVQSPIPIRYPMRLPDCKNFAR
jgi:hypothetical protein